MHQTPQRVLQGSKLVDDVLGEGGHAQRKPKSNFDSKPIAPLKERNSLLFLEKPVHIESLNLASELPEDVRDLYRRIQSAAVYKEAILPPEMREEINKILGNEAREVSFRKPLASANEPGGAKAAAWLLHIQICEVLEAAGIADLQKRHECGWNSHIHGAVLNLVFTSLLSRAGFRPQKSRRVVARYEAVQTATITKDSAPHWKEGGPAVTVSSTEQSGYDSSEYYEELEPNPDRSRTNKVDYVVVLRNVDDEPLRQAIRRVAFNNETGTGYVNQTAYNPIFDTPIAVSIATREASSNDDPMLQLGLWVAAWHKRMYALRQRSFPSPPVSWLPDSMSMDRDIPPPLQLISVPLIQAVGHEWKLYFACDSISSISLYGPVSLGSTSNILDLYSLVTCLLLIQDWVESTFYEGMRTWFLHEDSSGNVQEGARAQ